MQVTQQNDEDIAMQNEMEKMVNTYDSFMEKFCLGKENSLREMTVDLADVKPGDCVLEVGCATGTLALAIKQKVESSGKVFGIDIIPGMIEVSQRKAKQANLDVRFQVGNIENIPFPDDYFNIVICSFMIFHMSEGVRKNGCKEIYRVLKSGGHLFLLDTATLEGVSLFLKKIYFTEIEIEKTKFASTEMWYLKGKANKTL
jgi:ubiquinone/menaquinone biosynthesis C-methylase UbiE